MRITLLTREGLGPVPTGSILDAAPSLGRLDRSRASLPTPGYTAILDAVAEIDPDFDCGAIMAQFSTGA